MGYWYVDSSAALKLLVDEAESSALRDFLATSRWVLSDLHRTELRRAVGRAMGRAPGQVAGAATASPLLRLEALLDAVDLLVVDAEVFERAGHLAPAELRSLDALHLAVAMGLGEDLEGLVAYDHRLLAVARELGLEVVSPGASA